MHAIVSRAVVRGLWREPREKTITWRDPLVGSAAGTSTSGPDFLGAIRDGVLAPTPMAQHFNFAIEEVQYGRVVFTCDVDESANNPIGLVHGGLVCTLADTVIGCAVHSTFGTEFAYNSIDISVSYLQAVTRESGTLRAELAL